MSDPFANLMPVNGRTSQAVVRECTHNQTLSAWRNANVAMTDLYICDANYIPKALDQDGKLVDFESRQKTMEASGAKPMYRIENGKYVSNDEIYTDKFNNVQPERVGKSSDENRPKQMRVVMPISPDPVTDETKPTAFKENINV